MKTRRPYSFSVRFPLSRELSYLDHIKELYSSSPATLLSWATFRRIRLLTRSKRRLISKRRLPQFNLTSKDLSTFTPKGGVRLKRFRSRRRRFRRRTIRHVKRNYAAPKLRFHSRYFSSYNNPNAENHARACWRRKNPLRILHTPYDYMTFCLETYPSHWYFQNRHSNIYTTKPRALLNIYNLLILWLRYEHIHFTSVVSLTGPSYLNDKVLLLNQFFNFNRHLAVNINTDVATNVISGKATSLGVNSLLYSRSVLVGRPTTLVQSMVLTTQLKVRRYVNTILLLSRRYMRYLNLQQHYRAGGKWGKLCTFLIERRLSTFPSVGLAVGEIPISLVPIASTRLLSRPLKGLSSSLSISVNDNILEHLCDNHISRHVASNLLSSVVGSIRSLKVDLVTRECGSELRYHKSWGMLKPIVFSTAQMTTSTFLRKSYIPKANIFFSNSEIFKGLYENPTLFKYFLWNQYNLSVKIDSILTTSTLQPYAYDLHRFNFSSRINFYENSNLWPSPHFNLFLRKKMVKKINLVKFVPRVTLWYYNTLVKFMEYYTSRKVYLKFNPFIENSLPYVDLARCSMWEVRVYGFQKILGHRIFVNESLRILHLALRFRDPTFLSHWMKTMLYRMSFWKYRLLFRYVKFTMRYLFWAHFEELGFKGLKFLLRGKISVGGNSRTRTLVYTIGETSHAKVNNRVLSEFTTINSFTGVMGFLVSFYF